MKIFKIIKNICYKVRKYFKRDTNLSNCTSIKTSDKTIVINSVQENCTDSTLNIHPTINIEQKVNKEVDAKELRKKLGLYFATKEDIEELFEDNNHIK